MDQNEAIFHYKMPHFISISKAENTRLERTADLREKDQHILKSTSMKQQENPADFSSAHKVQSFLAQICCHFTPCISRFTKKSPDIFVTCRLLGKSHFSHGCQLLLQSLRMAYMQIEVYHIKNQVRQVFLKTFPYFHLRGNLANTASHS